MARLQSCKPRLQSKSAGDDSEQSSESKNSKSDEDSTLISESECSPAEAAVAADNKPEYERPKTRLSNVKTDQIKTMSSSSSLVSA